jgi:purine-nucleoside phosphorylase
MLLRDHLNLMFKNPLVGPNEEALGPRFPDMTHVYDPALAAATHAAAESLGIRLHEGVYAGLLGPSYETPAEIRMLRVLGADAVGMSTVPEAIALRHMRRRVTGISLITNLAAGTSPHELSHAEVEEAARKATAPFGSLVSAWVERAAAVAQEDS